METLSIGQVARRAGVGVETVRFYEREGLLEEPPRRASGYRQYSEEVVKRIGFIKRAKALGFSLKEISDLLLLRVDAQTSYDEVKQRTEAKIAEVERKLVELQRMRQALLQVHSLCQGSGPTGRCPMLEALDQQEPLDQTEPTAQWVASMTSPLHSSPLVILGDVRVAISPSKHIGVEKGKMMDTIQEQDETGQLNPLFEARLQYQPDMGKVVSAETQEGELVGSGDGTVTGAALSGTVRWSMYAGNCTYVFVRAGRQPPPGQHFCTVQPAGIIETSDGAEVWFDARGYGLRGADQSQQHLWRLTMAVQFTTTDRRYQWLNTTLGVVISEFDERAGRAHWRAFIL